MMTWGELRDKIRESILRDIELTIGATMHWSDEEILNYFQWSVNDLCSHTAFPVELTFTDETVKDDNQGDPIFYDMAEDKEFHLDPEPYVDVDRAGIVFIERAGRVTQVKYNPAMRMGAHGYHTWPSNTLHLCEPPGKDATLYVRYFGYYPLPEQDEDPIVIPQWSIAAVCYMVGAHALGAPGLRSAMIRQWDEHGNREQNPLRVQQKWFHEMYEMLLSRYPRQNRQPLVARETNVREWQR
jgi:hypothetical protein